MPSHGSLKQAVKLRPGKKRERELLSQAVKQLHFILYG